jgi:hypothetical protein
MKTATARLDIEVFVDCHHSDHLIDLVKPEYTAGYDHNEEGYVLSQACPNGHWSEEHKNFEVEEVECSSCGNTFNVKGLDW